MGLPSPGVLSLGGFPGAGGSKPGAPKPGGSQYRRRGRKSRVFQAKAGSNHRGLPSTRGAQALWGPKHGGSQAVGGHKPWGVPIPGGSQAPGVPTPGGSLAQEGP